VRLFGAMQRISNALRLTVTAMTKASRRATDASRCRHLISPRPPAPLYLVRKAVRSQ
jgi:hypothetical protein